MDTFKFSNPRHEQTYRRLQLIGPGPAAQYRDACRLMSDACETQTHLVAHLLREIESALRDVLEPIGVRKTRKGMSGDERHRDEIITILEALDISLSESVAEAWLRLPGRDNEYGLAGRAHRRALGPPRKMDAEFRAFWDEFNNILDIVLDRFEAHYLASLKTTDGLLQKSSPGDADIKVLRNNVPNNQVSFRHFFEHLNNPAWLPLLRDAGFFAEAPGPDRESEPGMVSYPAWPQAQYLNRMAPIEPGLVGEIALGVDDQENVSVRDDIVQIALALPPDLAARFVTKVTGWANPPHFLIGHRLVELVVHLASHGLVSPALELASGIFAIHAEPEEPFDLGDQEYQPPPKLVAHMDHWEYQEGLRQVIPALLAADVSATLEWLAGMLESAVDLHGSGYGVPSDSWRPAVEESHQNVDLDVKGPLVAALRDAALFMVRRDPVAIESLLQSLESRRCRIFRRIGLYLLSEMPDARLSLVAGRLMDPSNLNDTEVYHEYATLLKSWFSRLQDDQQSMILRHISNGPPSLEGGREHFKERTGREMTPEEEARAVRRWQQRRLADIKDSLPEEWRQRFEEMVVEFGEVEHPDFLSYMSDGAVGPVSPKTAAELKATSVSEIIAYLRSWQPVPQPLGHFGPSREGLSRELVSVIKETPERFAAEAMTFKELDATYVRALFEGLEQAALEKRAFPWRAVLELAAWAVAQPLEISGRDERGYSLDADPSWAWTRGAAADLISAGFDRDLPLDLRQAAWNVLEQLTRGTGEALESVRERALRAVIHYALWLMRREREHPGLDRVPEVRAVLEAHLDQSESNRIHALYGEWFPWLVWLDPAWTTSHLNEIFPTAEGLRSRRDAAWSAYINSCAAYDEPARALTREYDRAIQQIPLDADGKPGNASSSLAEHLMVLYVRGELPLEPGGLLERFFERAPDALRAHALDYLGWVVGHQSALSGEWVARLKALWEHRVQSSRDNPARSCRELASFGSWFATRKLDDQWALEQVRRALSLVRTIHPEYMVMKELASVCERHPLEALECVTLMIGGARQPWTILHRKEQITKVITVALQSTDSRIKQAAVELVNRLGALGHLEFGSLLA